MTQSMLGDFFQRNPKNCSTSDGIDVLKFHYVIIMVGGFPMKTEELFYGICNILLTAEVGLETLFNFIQLNFKIFAVRRSNGTIYLE